MDSSCSESMTLMASNDLILKAMSNYLPLEDVKHLRLTNWKWSSALHNVYFKSTHVILESFSDVTKYTEEIGPFTHSSFSFYFYSYQKANFEIPIMTKFLTKFGNQIDEFRWRVMVDCSTDIWNIQKLINQYLPNVRKLDLRIAFKNIWILDPPSSEYESQTVCNSVTNLTVKFTSLNLTEEELFHHLTVFNLGPFADFIVNSYPNVKILTICNGYCQGSLNTTFSSRFFGLLNGNQILKNLEELHTLANKSTPGHLANLNLTRRFKKLTLFFTEPCTVLGWKELEKAFEQQGESLESLRIVLIPVPTLAQNLNIGLQFPNKMRKLRRLEILVKNLAFNAPTHWENCDLRFSNQLEDYDYTFPNLESLTLQVHGSENFRQGAYRHLLPDFDGPFTSICCNVKELQLDYEYQSCNANVEKKDLEKFLERLTSMFPFAYEKNSGWEGVRENRNLKKNQKERKMKVLDAQKIESWDLASADPSLPPGHVVTLNVALMFGQEYWN